jgi:glucose/arabinose dehydrogenase
VFPTSRRSIALIVGAIAMGVPGQATAQPRLTLHLTDYLQAPMTGAIDGVSNRGSLARINVLREEPGGRQRLFLCDLNGPLYLVDKATGAFVTYLDFNGANGRPGMFKRFSMPEGFATGLINFQFDPAYATNGRFYTIHMENPSLPGSALPDVATAPGLNTAGYTITSPVVAPGTTQKQTVLLEWTDANLENATFEGTAREVLRIETNSHIHPMGDLAFDPTARPGSRDWGVMYVASGDGGSGEQTNLEMRHSPQRLDTLVGKILRIIPDLSLHVSTSTVSANGRYRIPRDNPFVTVRGARPEIWALGLRNPHRLTWTIDPEQPERNRLIANTIGLRTWETINIIRKGANYGYSEREGHERLEPNNGISARPTPDRIPLRINATETSGTLTPTYPVAQYRHQPGGGDAIAGGLLYRGKAFPALRGKYLTGDISTGRVWYADYREMLAADDGKPETMATLYVVDVRLEGASIANADSRPRATAPAAAGAQPAPVVPEAPLLEPRTEMWRIVEAAYRARGGTDPDLPGRSTVSGSGRVDLRFAEDESGEIYVLSKSDGMIRRVIDITIGAVPVPPVAAPPAHPQPTTAR